MSVRSAIGIVFAGYIALICCLLFTPFLQNHFLFLNLIQYPGFDPSSPELYGFRERSVRNLYLTTPDDLNIGLWHVIPHTYLVDKTSSPIDNVSTIETNFDRQAMDYYQDNDDLVYDELLARSKTIFIYFHGNAGNRGQGNRIAKTKMLMKCAEDAHVVTFDYRGFGESEGSPTDVGVVIDAHTVYDWVLAKSGVSSQIFLVGESLGSAVAVSLAKQLESERKPFAGLIMMCPFASIADAALSYGSIPLVMPLKFIPNIEEIIDNYIEIKFHNHKIVLDLESPLMLIHGDSDFVVPVHHSDKIFEGLVTKSSSRSFLEFRYGKSGIKRVSSDKMVSYYQIFSAGHGDLHRYDLTAQAIVDFVSSIVA